MTRTLCHNCSIDKDSRKKPIKGVWVKINKTCAWFHSKTCFNAWNKKYDKKYEGGIITIKENES